MLRFKDIYKHIPLRGKLISYKVLGDSLLRINFLCKWMSLISLLVAGILGR